MLLGFAFVVIGLWLLLMLLKVAVSLFGHIGLIGLAILFLVMHWYDRNRR